VCEHVDTCIVVLGKLHNEEFYNLYCFTSIIRARRMRGTEHMARAGVGGFADILVGISATKGSHVRPRSRLVNNVNAS
jgi:hypothetical protein